MATRGKKISEQTLATSLDGNEIIPFAKNGADGAVKVSKLLSKTVAPEEGKGLSTNDFTNEYKAMIEQNSDKIISLENKHSQFALTGFWRPDGTIGTDTNYYRTGLIPINKNHDITVNVSGTKNVAALAMFDAQGVCIWYRKTTDTESTVRTTITVQAADIPSNAVYFSTCTYIGYGNLAKSSWSNGDTLEARESAVSDVVQRSKELLFIDQWKSLSNLYTGLTTEYDVATDKFLLHWNYNNQEAKKYEPKVTYEQAMAMVAGIQNSVLGYSSFSITAPANLPPIGYHAGSGPYLYIDHPDVCLYNPNIQVLIFATQKNGIVTTYKNPVRLTNLLGLKAVIGVFQSAEPNIHGLEFVKGTGPGFPKLEFFRVQIKQSFDVRTSPLLTLDTMQYLVTNAKNTEPITVTVHPDVYAKLTGDTANAAASALTADELAQWQALVTTANSKNISFATTSN